MVINGACKCKVNCQCVQTGGFKGIGSIKNLGSDLIMDFNEK